MLKSTNKNKYWTKIKTNKNVKNKYIWLWNLSVKEDFEPSTSFPSTMVRDSEDEKTLLLQNINCTKLYFSYFCHHHPIKIVNHWPCGGPPEAFSRGLPGDELGAEARHLVLHAPHLTVEPGPNVVKLRVHDGEVSHLLDRHSAPALHPANTGSDYLNKGINDFVCGNSAWRATTLVIRKIYRYLRPAAGNWMMKEMHLIQYPRKIGRRVATGDRMLSSGVIRPVTITFATFVKRPGSPHGGKPRHGTLHWQQGINGS